MKNLVIILVIILNMFLVACSDEQTTTTSQNSAEDYSTVYNETMKNIIADGSDFAANMTNEEVDKNNVQVFADLQKTLKAAGCYNDTIEKAYFNAEKIKLGYKPAEYSAMCMIAEY